MLEPLAMQHTMPIAVTLVATELCCLLHAEAGGMVQISARHDDTSISMNASAVSLQGDTHIAQTDGGHDSGAGIATQCSHAELSSAAQHSNVTDTYAPHQDLPQPLQESEPKPTHVPEKSTQVTAVPDTCALHHTLDRPAVSQSRGDQWHLEEPGQAPTGYGCWQMLTGQYSMRGLCGMWWQVQDQGQFALLLGLVHVWPWWLLHVAMCNR